MKKECKIIKFSSTGYHNYNVSRILYVDREKNPKFKYYEYIEFEKNIKENVAICVGLNPAAAEEDLDTTNKRLIKLLRRDYKGYYLLNLYPEITDNKTQIDYANNENIVFVNFLGDFLQEPDKSKLDVILFFGRTVILNQEQIDIINSLLSDSSRHVYITTHNGEFTHPGSNGDIKKQPMKKEYFQSNICIRINQ